jgi:hypothetical protein
LFFPAFFFGTGISVPIFERRSALVFADLSLAGSGIIESEIGSLKSAKLFFVMM